MRLRKSLFTVVLTSFVSSLAMQASSCKRRDPSSSDVKMSADMKNEVGALFTTLDYREKLSLCTRPKVFIFVGHADLAKRLYFPSKTALPPLSSDVQREMLKAVEHEAEQYHCLIQNSGYSLRQALAEANMCSPEKAKPDANSKPGGSTSSEQVDPIYAGPYVLYEIYDGPTRGDSRILETMGSATLHKDKVETDIQSRELRYDARAKQLTESDKSFELLMPRDVVTVVNKIHDRLTQVHKFGPYQTFYILKGHGGRISAGASEGAQQPLKNPGNLIESMNFADNVVAKTLPFSMFFDMNGPDEDSQAMRPQGSLYAAAWGIEAACQIYPRDSELYKKNCLSKPVSSEPVQKCFTADPNAQRRVAASGHQTQGGITSSNDQGAITSSSDQGAITSSSDQGAITSSNDQGAITSSNDQGAITSSSDQGAINSSSDQGGITSSSDQDPMTGGQLQGALSDELYASAGKSSLSFADTSKAEALLDRYALEKDGPQFGVIFPAGLMLGAKSSLDYMYRENAMYKGSFQLGRIEPTFMLIDSCNAPTDESLDTVPYRFPPYIDKKRGTVVQLGNPAQLYKESIDYSKLSKEQWSLLSLISAMPFKTHLAKSLRDADGVKGEWKIQVPFDNDRYDTILKLYERSLKVPTDAINRNNAQIVPTLIRCEWVGQTQCRSETADLPSSLRITAVMGNYSTDKKQRIFKLQLTGLESDMQAITKVEFDVHSTFGTNQFDIAKKVATQENGVEKTAYVSREFWTYSPWWRTNGALVEFQNRPAVFISGARIDWQQ